jgi:hypothetical protein
MPPRTDRGQHAALRRLRAAFGSVQVLAVHPSEIQVEPAGPALASQQLALTIPIPPAPRRRLHHPSSGRRALSDLRPMDHVRLP